MKVYRIVLYVLENKLPYYYGIQLQNKEVMKRIKICEKH